MKGRSVCFCPASIAWIRKHLMKSARRKFILMMNQQIIKKVRSSHSKKKRSKSRKRPTAKQLAARRLFVKRVKRGDFR